MKRINLTVLLLGISLNIFPQVYIFDSIPDNLKKRADAVVRSEQCLFTLEKPGTAVMKIRKAITLLNEDADSYRRLRIYYDKYSKVSNLRGTVYDEKGNLIKYLAASDVEDMSAMSGAAFYSDDRVKIMFFPIYKFPYTIEYEYEIEYTSLLNYPTWEFQDSPDVSVEKSGIQFIVPENMTLRYYEEYMTCKADTAIRDGRKIYTWQEENLPAYMSQEYAIRRVYHSPTLYTAPLDFEYGGFKGSMRSWRDFGNWVYEINKERDALPETEVTAIREVTSKTSDPREKVRLVYEYMQSRTRYVSIQIGIGGYRTAEASAVAKNGFGDCKALVNYTLSLLKAAGINSYITLVNSGTIIDINPGFVDNYFNHWILCVPMTKDTIWLECTNQTNPFNYLGLGTAAKHVLLLTPEGGKMVKTPGFTKYQNLEKRTGSLYMNVLGTSSGNISNYYSGSYFETTSGRYSLQSEEEMKRTLNSRLRFMDLSIKSVTYTEEKSEDPSARLLCQLTIKDFATGSGQMMYFNPSISLQSYLPETPVHLRVPFVDITSDSIVYNLPVNYRVDYKPEDISVENEFGKFIYYLESVGDKLVYRRIFELYESDIPFEKYNDFREFINLVAKTDREKIILVRSDV